MPPYTYTPLADPDLEIRLLIIQPGRFDETIKVTLQPAPLFGLRKKQPETQRLSVDELQASVPQGWQVFETREGRIIFDSGDGTSWEHPDEGFPRGLYETVAEPTEGVGGDADAGCVFEALSYTWGSPDDPTTEILVTSSDDHCTVGTMLARRNLHTALQHFRYLDRPRTMWIDALCINQADDDEKSRQIRRMGDLYKAAHRVVVWLGPASADSALACSTLAYLGAQMVVTKDNRGLRHPDAVEKDWCLARSDLPYEEATWLAIHNLLARPWFERLWIWQEIVLADNRATIQCGYEHVPWTVFRRAIIRLRVGSQVVSPEFKLRITFADQLAFYQMEHPFWRLTNGTGERKCFEPRDKIYALLSVAPEEYTQAITVDYKRSVGEVYRDAFLAHVDTFGNLALFAHCCRTGRKYEMPSWVPDWSAESSSVLYTLDGFFASGQSSAHAQYVGPGILEVNGVICATINRVSCVCSQDPSAAFDDVISWAPELEGTYPPNGQTMFDAYIETLLMNRTFEYMRMSQLIKTKDAKDRFLATFGGPNSKLDKESLLNDSFVEVVLRRCRGRAFIETNKGYIGIAPAEAQIGTCPSPDLHFLSLINARRPSLHRFRLQSSGSPAPIGIWKTSSHWSSLRPWPCEL